MKTNEILQGNRTLAEFMGFRNGFIHYVDFQTDLLYSANEANYHISWGWLMPVVEKILNICQESDEMGKYYIITDAIPEIESVFAACVEFAKWYKNQAK